MRSPLFILYYFTTFMTLTTLTTFTISLSSFSFSFSIIPDPDEDVESKGGIVVRRRWLKGDWSCLPPPPNVPLEATRCSNLFLFLVFLWPSHCLPVPGPATSLG